MNEYSAVKDRFLEQFFRRETRVKILNALPRERRSDNLSSLRNPESKRHSPNHSNYHNIREDANFSHMLPQAEVSPSSQQAEQGSDLRLPPAKRSTHLTRIRTLAKEKSHLSSQELSREDFKDFLAKARERLLAKSKLQGTYN